MISLESLSKKNLYKQSKLLQVQDPAVLERTAHAFVLLERLALTKIDFLFKGGTALLLLLDRPARVSVDIDIICTLPKKEFDEQLKEWVRYPPFIRWEEDRRKSNKEPPSRRHYKLYYNAQCGGFKDPYVILDVVEEECGIGAGQVKLKEIHCPFLIQEGNPSKVSVPMPDALLGDKLTAFAPNTAGVHFHDPRLQEDSSHQVFKQLFDVAQLFDAMSSYPVVCQTYLSVVRLEARYKKIKGAPEIVLLDTLQTAFDICTFDLRRRKLPPEYEKCITGGIRKMGNDLINGEIFSIPEAKAAAAKAAYLAAHILTGQERLLRYRETPELLNRLKSMKHDGSWGILDRLKGNAANYYYWSETAEMLKNIGCSLK